MSSRHGSGRWVEAEQTAQASRWEISTASKTDGTDDRATSSEQWFDEEQHLGVSAGQIRVWHRRDWQILRWIWWWPRWNAGATGKEREDTRRYRAGSGQSCRELVEANQRPGLVDCYARPPTTSPNPLPPLSCRRGLSSRSHGLASSPILCHHHSQSRSCIPTCLLVSSALASFPRHLR